MDALCLGKEAIYRRLRGEVPFTLEEAFTISQALDISLDDIAGGSSDNKPFKLKLTEFVDPIETDFRQMEMMLNFMRSGRKEAYSEIGYSANTFPKSTYLEFEYLTRFFMFRWLYQWRGIGMIKALEDIKISERLRNISRQYVEEAQNIKYTYHVWDHFIFHYLINDIKYFANARLITQDDVLILKEELSQFADKLETLAVRGKYENGNTMHIYLSDLNFDSTYNYLQTEKLHLSQLKVFTMSSMISTDELTFSKFKKWVWSLKRVSTLISESGELDRARFFNEQRQLINSLSNLQHPISFGHYK